MARIITMPTSPNFVRSNFSLFRAVGQTASPFTGKVLTQEFDAVYWQAEVTLPPLNRSQAVEWQSFLLQLKGATNHFKFADPDALTNRGTYDGTHLVTNSRVSNTSVTLSFSGNTITAGASTFGSNIVGDYIHVTGADNAENNGTHKITTTTSATVVVVDTDLVTESNTASCKVQNNIKGAEGLNLLASSTSADGTILKGDYLAVLDSTSSATANPVQLLMVTENATKDSSSTKKYAVRTQPKLRTSPTNATYVLFASPKGRFRLNDNSVEWSANQNGVYTMSFSCHEVI